MSLSHQQRKHRPSQRLHLLHTLLHHGAASTLLRIGLHPSTRPSVCLSVHPVSLSGASPLRSSWTRRVGRRLQFVSCSTPLPLLGFLPGSSGSSSPRGSSSCCCSAFTASSLLLVSLPLLVAGAAGALRHLHRRVAACEREVALRSGPRRGC